MERSDHHAIGARKVDSQSHQPPVSEQSRPRLDQSARLGVEMTGLDAFTFRRMLKPTALPVVLTIAGSDSGGGAGIQADLKTFAALGVHGTSAITAITAQNTLTVTDIFELPPEIVVAQIDAIAGDLGVAAAKTGMLASSRIIEAVAKAIAAHAISNLVVDP